MLPELSIIGIGNLGYHLASAFGEAGYPVKEIFSRNKEKAQVLAAKLGARVLPEPVPQESDTWAFICLPDDMIRNFQRPAHFRGHLVHCSGNVPLQVFDGPSAVFYPLQSFSRDREPDFSSIPVLLESSQAAQPDILLQMAHAISKKVVEVSSEQRSWVHLGAVFVNNFTNALAGAGMELLQQKGLDAGLLLPLLRETTTKLELMGYSQAQTGPAKRGDQRTMQQHLQMLEAQPQLRDVYAILSEMIRKQHS